MDLPLLAELQRRRVFRALVGYGIAAFAVLQIVEPVMHGLHWPDEVLSYVVVALAVGFPVVVSLAWIFDVNAGRIERTLPTSTGPKGTRLGLLLIGVGLLAATPGVVWYFVVRGHSRQVYSSAAGTGAATPSIAVLPFVDMSPGKDQEYFSDGITEELLNLLAKVPDLHVAGRTSAFVFKGKSEDLRAIGQKLNVAHLLEGSVRKSGDQIRITAQLISANDGYHLWSETYDRKLSDVFAVQDEIAGAVVAALKVKLLPGRELPTKSRAASPGAFTQYMLGRQFWFRGAGDDAIAAYQKAMELDPGFAAPWAGAAMQYLARGESSSTREAGREGCKRGLEAAEKAIAIDPTSAEGFTIRGIIRADCSWDWTGANADMKQALALSPGDTDSQRRHAILQLHLGRVPEAIAGFRRAVGVDPFMPYGWNWLAWAYLANRQFDLARHALDRASELAPGWEWTTFGFITLSLLEGQPAAALDSMRKGKFKDEVSRLSLLAAVQHDLGHPIESREALQALMSRLPVLHGAQAVAASYAWFGDRDRAFEWLERAYSERDMGLVSVKWSPDFNKLHDDPRFAALLRRMNLPTD